jgi:hypothetical protein
MFRSRHPRGFGPAGAAAALLVLASACGDNPVDQDVQCDHIDADGVRLSQGNVVLAEQFNGVQSGGIDVDAGTVQAGIDVTFLEEESVGGVPTAVAIVLDPACTGDHTLGLSVEDPVVAEAYQTEGQEWSLNVRGIAAGSTTLRVRIVHGDHDDFVSLPIPIVVADSSAAPAIAPEALWVTEAENVQATWNYHANGPGVATGPLLVEVGATRPGLEIVFGGAWDPGSGGHGSGGRPEIEVPDGPYAVRWTVAEPSVAALHALPGEITRFDLEGLTAGMTTVTLELLFRGVAVIASGPIPLVCVDPAAAEEGSPSFTCVASGLKSVIVDEGAVLPALAPGEGAPCGWWTPGAFEVDVGAQTSLYSVREFRVLADPCATSTLGDGTYRLSFSFADPGIARVVNHPFHWDEITIFHVEGLSPGSTTLRLWVTNKTTGALRWASPPMPVTVAAA